MLDNMLPSCAMLAGLSGISNQNNLELAISTIMAKHSTNNVPTTF